MTVQKLDRLIGDDAACRYCYCSYLLVDAACEPGCQVNHLYAANTRDGATAYHRAVQFADKLPCLNALVTADSAGINVQDSAGLSPLHVACKLGRRTIVKRLLVPPTIFQLFFRLKQVARS